MQEQEDSHPYHHLVVCDYARAGNRLGGVMYQQVDLDHTLASCVLAF